MTSQEALRFIEEIGGNVQTEDTGEIVKISLAGTAITDSGLQSITNTLQLDQLGILYLAGTQITGAGLGYLARTKLEVLFLAGCTQLKENEFQSIATLRRIKRLFLAGCTQLTGNVLQYVKHLQDLEVLCLDGMDVRDQHLAGIGVLGKLKSLSMSNTQVTYEVFFHLETLKSLTVLGLNNTQKSNLNVSTLLEKMEKLAVLSLIGMETPPETIAKLKQTFPNLEIIT